MPKPVRNVLKKQPNKTLKGIMKGLLNQNVVTSQSFDEWWRETGQFIGVAAQATGDELELLRRYAVEAMKDVRSATEWQELETEFDDADKRVDELVLLREKIVEVMEAATTSGRKSGCYVEGVE